MKINLPQRPGPNADLKTIVSYLSRFSEVAIRALSRNVSFTDNISGALITGPSSAGAPANSGLALAHGVPTLVKNPLPQNAKPIGVEAKNCDTQPNPNLKISYSATVNGVFTIAPAGYFYLTAFYPLANSPVSSFQSTLLPMTTNVVLAITSIVVPPGSWSLSSLTRLSGAPTGTGGYLSGIGTSATGIGDLTGGNNEAESSVLASASADVSIVIPGYPVSPTVSTTYFLKTRGTFTGGAVSALGRLSAIPIANPSSLTANVTIFVAGA